jgi:hypothetical protein
MIICNFNLTNAQEKLIAEVVHRPDSQRVGKGKNSQNSTLQLTFGITTASRSAST